MSTTSGSRAVDAAVTCPACERPVAAAGRTVGDHLECPACHAGLLVDVRSRGAADISCRTRIIQAAAEPRVGATLSERYTVAGVLGRGGQGTVYRVRPAGGHTDYALKFVDASARLAGVADPSAELEHPHIVGLRLLGTDPDSQRAYAIYEIVEGEALSEEIARGPLALERAFDLMFQVAAGLTHSHQHGIVHRDIKPQNIVVTPDGTAKILDFGVGVYIGRRNELDPSGSQGFAGTPGYAAPEQVCGWGAIRTSDVYALGVTFYEAVAGRRPFSAPSLEVLLHHQVNTPPPPPSHFRPHLPAAIDELVLAMIERDPTIRPATMEIVADGMRRAARALGLPVRLVLDAEPVELTSLADPAVKPRALARTAVVLALLALPLALATARASGVAWGAPLAALEAAGAGLVGWFVWRVQRALDVRPLDWLGAGGLSLAAVVASGAGLLVWAFARATEATHGTLALGSVLPAGGLAIAAFAAVLPVGVRWILDLAVAPAADLERRGLGLLDVRGPASIRVSLDGGPAVSLPSRQRARPGPHRLEATHSGASALFRITVAPSARHVLTLGAVQGVPDLAPRAPEPDVRVPDPLAMAAALALSAALIGPLAGGAGAWVPRQVHALRAGWLLAEARREESAGNFSAALIEYGAVSAGSELPEAYMGALRMLGRLRDAEGARRLVQRSLASLPPTAEAYEALGQAYEHVDPAIAAGAYYASIYLEPSKRVQSALDDLAKRRGVPYPSDALWKLAHFAREKRAPVHALRVLELEKRRHGGGRTGPDAWSEEARLAREELAGRGGPPVPASR